MVWTTNYDTYYISIVWIIINIIFQQPYQYTYSILERNKLDLPENHLLQTERISLFVPSFRRPDFMSPAMCSKDTRSPHMQQRLARIWFALPHFHCINSLHVENTPQTPTNQNVVFENMGSWDVCSPGHKDPKGIDKTYYQQSNPRRMPFLTTWCRL